jgi:carbonic anhydrase
MEVLRVEHVIVCGHYACGGIAAAQANRTLGLIDNWLRHAQDVMQKHAALLEGLSPEQQASERGQAVAVHGWIYGLTDGLLQDLAMNAAGARELEAGYRRALDGVSSPK